MSYKEAVAYAMKLDQKLVPYENERGMAATREAVEAVRPGESIGIFIGPEGGFAPEEIEAVKGEMKLISLGSRILRTETAGFTTLAILMYHIETSCLENQISLTVIWRPNEFVSKLMGADIHRMKTVRRDSAEMKIKMQHI